MFEKCRYSMKPVFTFSKIKEAWEVISLPNFDGRLQNILFTCYSPCIRILQGLLLQRVVTVA